MRPSQHQYPAVAIAFGVLARLLCIEAYSIAEAGGGSLDVPAPARVLVDASGVATQAHPARDRRAPVVRHEVVSSRPEASLEEISRTVPAPVPGKQGPPGSPGTPGQEGKKGDQGYAGVQGKRGMQGEPGIAGVPGTSGHLGSVGPPGAKGDKGPAGGPGKAAKAPSGYIKASAIAMLLAVNMVTAILLFVYLHQQLVEKYKMPSKTVQQDYPAQEGYDDYGAEQDYGDDQQR
mmetsp:Transcript_41262/g.93803  ORF Transcript_41262/g.93803 Transcript_41262/m.93803 type:complete len:233 (-) Transcript_41262:85-783(-)